MKDTQTSEMMERSSACGVAMRSRAVANDGVAMTAFPTINSTTIGASSGRLCGIATRACARYAKLKHLPKKRDGKSCGLNSLGNYFANYSSSTAGQPGRIEIGGKRTILFQGTMAARITRVILEHCASLATRPSRPFRAGSASARERQGMNKPTENKTIGDKGYQL